MLLHQRLTSSLHYDGVRRQAIRRQDHPAAEDEGQQEDEAMAEEVMLQGD